MQMFPNIWLLRETEKCEILTFVVLQPAQQTDHSPLSDHVILGGIIKSVQL